MVGFNGPGGGLGSQSAKCIRLQFLENLNCAIYDYVTKPMKLKQFAQVCQGVER